MNQREAFVSQAKSWLNRKESDGSHEEIIDIYNQAARKLGLYIMSYSDPWCAAFVTACAWKCGITHIVAPSANCDSMIAWYKHRKEWYDRYFHPQRGDLVFYDWDGNGSSDHVGIVETVYNKTLRVIEGNISDSVGYRTIIQGANNVLGYGTPAFSDAEQEIDIPNPVDTQKTAISVPVLMKGDKGEAVRALQILLIGRHISCGGCGADGDFGNATEQAVKNFQTYKDLTVDGIAGRDTWSKLIGG